MERKRSLIAIILFIIQYLLLLESICSIKLFLRCWTPPTRTTTSTELNPYPRGYQDHEAGDPPGHIEHPETKIPQHPAALDRPVQRQQDRKAGAENRGTVGDRDHHRETNFTGTDQGSGKPPLFIARTTASCCTD